MSKQSTESFERLTEQEAFFVATVIKQCTKTKGYASLKFPRTPQPYRALVVQIRSNGECFIAKQHEAFHEVLRHYVNLGEFFMDYASRSETAAQIAEVKS